jgi:hypothetical protein
MSQEGWDVISNGSQSLDRLEFLHLQKSSGLKLTDPWRCRQYVPRNAGNHSTTNRVSHHSRPESSEALQWKPQILWDTFVSLQLLHKPNRNEWEWAFNSWYASWFDLACYTKGSGKQFLWGCPVIKEASFNKTPKWRLTERVFFFSQFDQITWKKLVCLEDVLIGRKIML